MGEVPARVYHGTSTERWSRDGCSEEGLYVTTSLPVASRYASEWGEEGELPLVVEIEMSAFQTDDLGPNLETVEQYADGLWELIGKDAGDLT